MPSREERLRKALQEQGLQSVEALGSLARGESQLIGDPQALVQQSFGAATDIARRELEAQLPFLLAQASGGAAARGISGSSQEAFNRAQIGAQAVRSLENLLSQQQALGGQALLEIPFRQQQAQLNAQQILFNQLLSSIQPQKSKLGGLFGALGAGVGAFFGAPQIGFAAGKAVGGGVDALRGADTGVNIGQLGQSGLG